MSPFMTVGIVICSIFTYTVGATFAHAYAMEWVERQPRVFDDDVDQVDLARAWLGIVLWPVALVVMLSIVPVMYAGIQTGRFAISLCRTSRTDKIPVARALRDQSSEDEKSCA